MTCPSCGYREAGGNFCSSCGSPLGALTCASCGAKPPAGSRFCPGCGAGLGAGAQAPGAPAPRPGGPFAAGRAGPAATGSSPAQSNLLAWVIGALMVVGAVLIVVIPRLNDGATVPPGNTTPVAGSGGLGASAVDLNSMTPREAADRLWNRVVAAAESGDSVEARTFVPMGIAAYQRVGTLDDDGLYHLSVLQRIGGDFEAAIGSAEQILSTNADHILGLSAAGEAALESGDRARADAYFQRLVDSFDEEQARGLPEYAPEAHGNLLPTLLENARTALAGGR